MKKVIVLILALILLLSVSGCDTKTPEQQIAEYETLFNQYRIDNGKEPLIFTDDLNKCAALRLEEIKVNYSHNSAGHYGYRLSENIVKGINDNEHALRAWDRSILHKGGMLSSADKYTGYAIDHGYAVQVFSAYMTINGTAQLPEGYEWPD
jgi:uncharacterized protein YkwD